MDSPALHTAVIDDLDRDLIRLFTDSPRQSVLDAARVLGVARGTVQARLDRLARRGVISGWGPRISPAALGYTVKAFVSLTINQAVGHQGVGAMLSAIPEILELHTVSGDSDLMAVVVARSNQDLQRVLDRISETGQIRRSSSVIVLDTLAEHRTDPLIASQGATNTPEHESVVS